MSMGYSDTHAAALNSQMSNIATVELAGQILGDATEALGMLVALCRCRMNETARERLVGL